MKILAALSLMLVACTDVGDTGATVDAAPGIDAVPRSCTVVEDLGELGRVRPSSTWRPAAR